MLRRSETLVHRARVPAIDAHNHLGPTPFSDGWDRRSAPELEAALDASNLSLIHI